MIMWLRNTPSKVAPIPASALRDRSLRDVGLELDPVGAQRLEGVGQLEELGLAVGPVRWNALPTHVQPISRRRCSGTIDR